MAMVVREWLMRIGDVKDGHDNDSVMCTADCNNYQRVDQAIGQSTTTVSLVQLHLTCATGFDSFPGRGGTLQARV